MAWILLAWHSHQKYKVGRVTGCHKHTLTHRGLVDWHIIALELFEIGSLARQKQHHRASCEKNFRITFIQGIYNIIPFGAFKIHSHNIHAVDWPCDTFLVFDDLKVVVEEINGDSILSGIVLLCSC